MKKIGFFGGSFDPLHFGHLNLAISLAEAHHLDEVLFCPVNRSPFKERDPIASAKHRLAMTLLGIQDIPRFRVCELEVERGGISYTVDTLRALNEERGQLYLLLSEESIESFHRWKEAEEIVRLAKPLIGSRSQAAQKIPQSPLQKILFAGLTPMPILEISSTEVRRRIKNNLTCSHLAPAIILDYIKRHRLYF